VKQTLLLTCGMGAAIAVFGTAHSQTATAPPSGATVPVTVDNFVRAESDMSMVALAKQGGLGKLLHRREPASIERQTVIRLNRDTLYSSGVFDLGAGPVTITMPEPGKRFMAMQVINEDHYVPNVFYGAGAHTLTRENVGRRYMVVAIRTLVDPSSPDDIKQAHVLQDSIKVSQEAPGNLDIPKWDAVSQKKVRDALLILASTVPDFKGASGTKEEVDPVRRLVGAAAAWGRQSGQGCNLSQLHAGQERRKIIYTLRAGDVPVDGFWSVSVYDAKGYYEPNKYGACSLNNGTAKKDADGSIKIQFGGCDAKTVNCLPITLGWNYMVRLYRPRPEVLNGNWHFPEAQPAS
jgi:hypothetical protein